MEEKRKGELCTSHSVTCQVDVCVQVLYAGDNGEDEYTCLGNSQMQKYGGESNGREEVKTKDNEGFGSLLEKIDFGE